jgi:hypothetical protein
MDAIVMLADMNDAPVKLLNSENIAVSKLPDTTNAVETQLTVKNGWINEQRHQGSGRRRWRLRLYEHPWSRLFAKLSVNRFFPP